MRAPSKGESYRRERAARRNLLPESVSLRRYQATRDRLSRRLFAATEAVAAYDWDSDTVRHLVREVSAAMGDEVDLLQRRCGQDAAPARDDQEPRVECT